MLTRIAIAAAPLASLIAMLALVSACGDTEFIGVERPGDPLRPVGEACSVDAQCDTGRCVGGACTDGECVNDDDCRDDEICVIGQCEKADDFACQTDQRPILSISQTSLTYEQVALGQSEDQQVTIENIGDCLLTLQIISFSQNTSNDFDCTPCSAEFFPQRVPPGRSLDVTVTYAPTVPAEAAGQLLIRGDDTTAGDDGLVAVNLAARYDGVPSLVVSPLSLSYGFVPFTAGGGGGSRNETITITNQGTGSAVLELERVFLDREQAFHITGMRQGGEPLTISAINPENPILVPPFNVDNPLSSVEIDVEFRPTDNRDFVDDLVIRPGGLADDQRVVVDLSGSSLGPPQIEVSATQLEYGAAGADAMPIGSVDFRQVTIRNNGQSELVIQPAMAGGQAAADFNVMPQFVPPISPGGAIILSIFYNPSQASDPVTPFSPTRPVEAALNITSNDTDPGSDVLKTVSLVGWARSGVQDQVLKVEMEFQNADNSWAGSDFRNVDLSLASTDGAVICTKPQLLDLNGNGTFGEPGEANDFCADWTSAGNYGQANWLALGAFEEPERIVLRGLGPDGANGEDFDIEVSYIEDCASIPTGLLSDILGIGGSILLGALGGAIGVPIAVNPSDISDTISSNCFDREGSTVTTRISLDGTVVASPQVRLGAKGDVRKVATIRRVNGAFCSLTPGVGAADVQCQ